MYILTPDTLRPIGKRDVLRVQSCESLATGNHSGTPFPRPEFRRVESHALALWIDDDAPHGLAFGSQVEIERLFAAFVYSVRSSHNIFDLGSAILNLKTPLPQPEIVE